MNTMTLEQFHAALKAQGVKSHIDFAFVCPMCKTVQSGRDLIAAGAGADFAKVDKYLAFSCYGRFTGAGSSRKEPDGNPCDWSLGGLFQFHELEVVTPDGAKNPRFALATPEQAQAHAAKHAAEAQVTQ
ncbi:VVA0879 family protein [Paraburkholderia sp. C35]|uniref:VVA0879 family protein n=1 Tax=Paraburkholderia sp. C35 TaxID=2126993 RepID=UPI000D692E87|nr:VVA0879 family protein [Paraburkholderia sp. C35]